MTAGACASESGLPWARASVWRLRPDRSKASWARERRLAGRAFRLSVLRARDRTTGGEVDPSNRTTSTGNSDAGNVAGRNPSHEAISRSCAAPRAGITRSAGTATPGSLPSLRALRLDFALRAHQLRRSAPAAAGSSSPSLGDSCRRELSRHRFPEGIYYVLSFDGSNWSFILKHDTGYGDGLDTSEVETCTVIRWFDILLPVRFKPSPYPPSGWLRDHLLQLVDRYSPDFFSWTRARP